METHWMRYVWGILVLAVVAAIAVIISMSTPGAAPQSGTIGLPDYAPAPTAADAVSAQQGFDVLISFTSSGFEPASITISVGERVRFTNNANTDLRLTSSNPSLFAGLGPITLRRYVEIGFNEAGEFQYSDATTGKTGVVIVR